MPKTLTPEIALAAIAGLELQKTQIDSQIAELRGMLDGSSREPTVPPASAKPRKKRSAAVRRRMKMAQQLRWRTIKEAAEAPQTVSPRVTKLKRKLSAAGRRNIIEATKRRWAAYKASKQSSKPALAKRAAARKARAKSVTA